MTPIKKSLYLAGPITGLTHDEARYGWRGEFVKHLRDIGGEHIDCFSPMRGKEFLENFGVLTSGDGYPDHPMSSPSGVTVRDCNDVLQTDVLVGCFLDTPQVQLKDGTMMDVGSLGTAWEFGAAYVARKPTIMIGAPNNVHVQHLMMKHSAAYWTTSIEEGAELAYYLLTPGL